MKHVTMSILFLSMILLTACGAAGPQAAGTTDQPTAAAAPVRAANRVTVDGRVVPLRYAALSLPAAGVVDHVLVAEGDPVKAGTVMIQLHAARQEAALAQAEAGLRRAQAALADLKAGPRDQEVAVAQAALQAAQAQLARVEQPARPEEIAAARAEVAAAQASLSKVLEGATAAARIAAEADLANAEAAVQQAQAAYDRVRGDPNIGALPQSLQLQQATISYTAARARYDDLLGGASAAEIALARAGVQAAQAALDILKAAPRAADVAAAQAEIRRAQAQLDLAAAGARPEAVAAAEADVAAAQAALQQARAALDDMTLKAPFDGIVASLDVHQGEQIVPGSPVAQLADTGAWRVETEDLTELDVVQIAVGDRVSITFDALPDLALSATVERIKALGETRQGDITYTVTVTPDQQDTRLRWNMTASVAFGGQ